MNFFSFLLKNLKDILANAVVAEQKRVGEFRKQHGSLKIGDVTIDMVTFALLLYFIYVFFLFHDKET